MLEEWVQSNSSLLNDDKEQEGQEENRNTSNDVSIHSRHDRGATKTTIKEQFLKTVELCASYLVLENIEPHDLLTIVSPSGFCTPESITKAITQQALRASQTKVWSLSSRGPDIERILVEGAGSKDANGIYYRVDGLANGELYSKREISCGQQFVYTLSISLKKSLDEVECRIFCSKLLTHRAIGRLVHKDRKKENKRTTIGNLSSGEDSGFHPILQVIGMSDEGNGITTIGNPIGRQVSSRHWVRNHNILVFIGLCPRQCFTKVEFLTFIFFLYMCRSSYRTETILYMRQWLRCELLLGVKNPFRIRLSK
jgi:hypothetical protein